MAIPTGGNFIVFETIIDLVIILSCFFVYLRTRELYKLSLQKGIRYFSLAFMLFSLTFVFKYIVNVMYFIEPKTLKSIFGIAVMFMTYYPTVLGGLFLSYSMIWRAFKIETKGKTDIAKIIFMNIFAALITVIEIIIKVVFGIIEPFVFTTVMLLIFLFSLIISKIKCRDKKCIRRKSNDPFISIVGLGFAIFIALFLGTIFNNIIPTMYYYVWGVATIFFVAVAHNVKVITD